MSTVRTLLDQQKIPPELLGNPVFEEGNTVFTQDKAVPLIHYIDDHTLEESKRVLEGYIVLVHALWRCGVSDAVFKFTENNGVAENGAVSQLDFGECTFQKPEVLALLQKREWLNKNSYKFLPDDELKAFVKKRFGEEFTAEKLDALWPNSL